MIGDLKPYPAMKDSGVPSLGAVPEHWDVRPLARLGQLFKGSGGSKEDEVESGIPCVRYGDLYTYHEFFITETRGFLSPESASSYTRIETGDLLLAASGETLEDIGRSAVNLLDGDVRCGGDIIVLRPTLELDPRYLGYAADSQPSRAQKATMGRGFTVVHIYSAQLKNLAIGVPPVQEQAAIVRFLGHADRQIRRYIRAKQKLISLLDEQKQAIVHRAITRGLDPKVRLKPSGVEWLGDVPEHWEVRRCRYIFREVDKRSVDGAEQHLSMSQRLGLIPSDLLENRTLVSESYAGGKLCEPGDLVLNRLKAHLGVFAIARCSGVISPDYTVLRPLEATGIDYFEQLLRSPACRRELRIRAKGIVEGFWRLYTDDLYDIRLPVPPALERKAIVDHFATEVATIDQAELRAEREIALLQEFRTRLIADVVTGKLDVREAAARLPDQAGEPEPIDEIEAEGNTDEPGAENIYAMLDAAKA